MTNASGSASSRSGCAPSTNQDAPLPARLGATPADIPDAIAPAGQLGNDDQRGGLQVVAAFPERAAQVVPGPVDGGRRHDDGRRHDA